MASPIAEEQKDKRTWLLGALACGLSALLYASSLRFDFVYDDRNQIVLNPLIRSWHNLGWLFKTDVWAFWNPLYVGNYWRPLFMVWLLLNHSLFGLSPAGWHALAVLTHAVATWFVFQLAVELSDDSLLALFAALIFAVHPSHIETVAWISGTTDSLMADFLLPSLICFVRGWKAATRKWAWYAGSSLLFACALLVKEPAVIFVPLVVVFAVLYSRPGWKTRIKEAALAVTPLLLVSAIYMTCRGAVLQGVGHDNLKMGLGDVLLSAPSLLWFYIKHLVWPVGLGLYYEIPPVQSPGLMKFWFPLFACLSVFIALVALCWLKRDRLCALGVAFLFLPILPVLYIPALPVDDFAHDRYLYLSSIGLALIVASLLRMLRWDAKRILGVPAFQFATVAVLVIALCASTASQQIYWASDVLLFRHAVDVAPGSANAFNNLGVALTTHGRMKEAMFAFEQVIKRNPKSYVALYNLGLGSFLNGKYPEAEDYLSRAVKIAPLESDQWAVLAEAQVHQKRFSQAEESIRNAIQIKPYKPGYQKVLAMALEGEGKGEEALEAARAELRASPEDSEAKALVSRLQTTVSARKPDTFSSQN